MLSFRVLVAEMSQEHTSMLSKELTRETVYVMYTQGPERAGTSCAGTLDFFDIWLYYMLRNAA